MKLFILNNHIQTETKFFLMQHGCVTSVLPNKFLPAAEACHADMQFTKVDDRTLFCPPEILSQYKEITSCGVKLIAGESHLCRAYPGSISYNLFKAGNIFFHNVKYTDAAVKKHLLEHGYPLIPVKQGYAGCSSIAISVFGNKILILTSDPGIFRAARNADDGFYTEYFTQTDQIMLPGYDHGFIGGCCGYDRDLGLLLYGKANRQLRELSAKYQFQITEISGGPLTDIGGILIMYPYL